jgi:hypothetical protein
MRSGITRIKEIMLSNEWRGWFKPHPCRETLWIWKIISIEKALFRFTNEMSCTLIIKIHVSEISCDLTKATDSVNHEILLMKSKVYGIRGVARQRFKPSLSNLRLKVEMKVPYSKIPIQNAVLYTLDSHRVRYWVPKGVRGGLSTPPPRTPSHTHTIYNYE